MRRYLTERQWDVLVLAFVEGRTNTEIAAHLGITESSVDSHLQAIRHRVPGLPYRPTAKSSYGAALLSPKRLAQLREERGPHAQRTAVNVEGTNA